MLKVLIVDDEYIVRRGLRKIVPWEKLEVVLAGEAECVDDAVDIAFKVYPDIVICDIRLPGGEGFVLIDEIRKIVPWVQFIMITAHSDKQYMLKAIYMGVCDYLFKPAKVEDIKEAVMRAREKVTAYHNKMKKDQSYQKFIQENLDVLRENFLRNLLLETAQEEKALEDGSALKLYLKGPYYRVLRLTVKAEELYEAEQLVSSFLEPWSPAIVQPEDNERNFAVLLNSSDENDEKIILEQLSSVRIEQIQISAICDKLSDLAKEYRLLQGVKQVGMEQGHHQMGQSDTELQQIKETLYEAVKYHDSMEEIKRLFHQYMICAKEKEVPEEEIVIQSRNMVDTIRILTGVPGGRREVEANLHEIYQEFSDLCNQVQEGKKYLLDDISGKALYFIKKRYMEDLSLEQIAAELFMSSSYLSRIIKERTGHGFGYWLNYYRIEAAKKKLSNPEKSIEEVASECGYHSYRIFSENFRKYTGKTASTWRLDKQ